MNIIAVDDEMLALEQILGVLDDVFQSKEKEVTISGFQEYKKALEYAKCLKEGEDKIDYAFLDMKLRGIRGIELAKQLKDEFPKISILFVTGYNEYACDAFQIHALGYILKPATRESIEEVLDSLRSGWRTEMDDKKKIRIQTFGNFDVFINDKPLLFERSKAKELLAYLVDRKGAGATTSEVSAILWEDREYNRNLKNQTQKIISCMVKSLKEAGIEDILIKKWNYLAIDVSKVCCDYYDFLNQDVFAVNTYMGEYMSNYSWAEFTTALLMEKAKRIN